MKTCTKYVFKIKWLYDKQIQLYGTTNEAEIRKYIISRNLKIPTFSWSKAKTEKCNKSNQQHIICHCLITLIIIIIMFR